MQFKLIFQLITFKGTFSNAEEFDRFIVLFPSHADKFLNLTMKAKT